MPQLFRLPGFRAVFAALAISMIGDSMMLAIPAILVRKGSGSNAAAGFEIVFFTLPICLAPMAGPFIDRFRRRPLLAVVSCLSALSLLPLLAVTTPGYWWTGYVVAAFLGCSYVSTSAGVSGLLPQIVPADRLGHANSLLQSFRQGLRLIGPLAGILIYARFGHRGRDRGRRLLVRRCRRHLRAAESAGDGDRAAARSAASPTSPSGPGSSMRTALSGPSQHRPCCSPSRPARPVAVTYAVVTVGLGLLPEFVGVLTCVMGVGAIACGFLSTRLITRLGELGAVGIGVLAYSMAIAGLIIPSTLAAIPAMALAGIGRHPAGCRTADPPAAPHAAERMARVSFALDSVANTAQLVTMASCASLLTVMSFRYLLIPAALHRRRRGAAGDAGTRPYRRGLRAAVHGRREAAVTAARH